MQNCTFCQIAQGKVNSWKIYENKNTFAFLDIHPVSKYHTLIIPKKHYRDIFDIPEDELREITSTIKKITTLYKEKVGIENVQVINSSGIKAQQDIFHVHFHIVPRESGDGQDIQWDLKPELVEDFDKLLKALKDGNML